MSHDIQHRPGRAVATVPATYALEGGGFGVYRPFPTANLELLDPFLLLDEMEPKNHEPGGFKGAPDHPHRGFETVTYLLEGEVEHRDSNGGHGIITAGGVQWMTAGDGIVHSEMPSRRLQTEGGMIHGFQLWVNLPQNNKRAKPRYQTITSDQIGRSTGDGWNARVIAGTLLGASGPTDTHTPIVYAHLTLDPGTSITVDLPVDHNVGVYGFKGTGAVDGEDVGDRTLAVAEPGEGALNLSVPSDADQSWDVLVMSGQPLNEPVARYGPFVMNTREEILEAVQDFNAGRMGTIPAEL